MKGEMHLEAFAGIHMETVVNNARGFIYPLTLVLGEVWANLWRLRNRFSRLPFES